MNTFATRSSSCCVAGVSNHRITREQVITLRNINVANNSLLTTLTRMVHACQNAIVTFVMTPAKVGQSSNSMCKYYGHVIQGAWEGQFPKCRDCNCEIQSPDQLRKSSPRH